MSTVFVWPLPQTMIGCLTPPWPYFAAAGPEHRDAVRAEGGVAGVARGRHGTEAAVPRRVVGNGRESRGRARSARAAPGACRAAASAGGARRARRAAASGDAGRSRAPRGARGAGRTGGTRRPRSARSCRRSPWYLRHPSSLRRPSCRPRQLRAAADTVTVRRARGARAEQQRQCPQ